jgi:AraC-like DNA-binding protein
MTPKLYCRIQRFQHVLRLIHRRQVIDWANVALSCGYYGQSHFVRDFRAFAGLSPTAYLQARTDHLNHVPLVD